MTTPHTGRHVRVTPAGTDPEPRPGPTRPTTAGPLAPAPAPEPDLDLQRELDRDRRLERRLPFQALVAALATALVVLVGRVLS
jgi:hypothetical protein